MPNRKLLPLFALAASAAIVPLQADPKLDEILAELQSLKGEVAALNQRVEALEKQESQELASPTTSPSKGNKKWIDSMRVELKKAEVRASGPWTNMTPWEKIENGMEEEEVVELLGEPTARKFSVRRDTDEILVYEGDLEGNGELIEGEVRIYKGKVRRFTVPDFPSE
ncbi:hypothetical protein [Pelagicoccus albus]|uniref:Type IV pilus biogenesis protein PilP n=1 Tax=Pelagicoccus albus TaxID=415222 RepID=A0A7X1B6X8_9BACT|nr:hypothetical protein [Pelagicoccus albus]MBC2606647.1 hypothetical protein [Pelagicoccus albus]